MNLGTSIHEILHASTHPDFTRAVRGTEQADLGVEGFTEFFTRRLYQEIVDRAATDDAFRLRIEGTPGPAFTPPPRTSYENFFQRVLEIFDLLGGNEENLRQPYFRGRVEFIGMGQWNELSRDLPTQRRHSIGGGVLFQLREGTITGVPHVQANYGYLVWGRSGAVQLDLHAGGGLTYLGEGHRVGLGPEVSFTLRGSHLFVTGEALLQGSTAVTSGGLERFDLDALFRLEAGVQIGLLHVGPNIAVLTPITNRDNVTRGDRALAGLGLSFVYGR